MSAIAMFGGSFNPVHNGHTGIVSRMINEFSLDMVYVIPTYQTPLKDNSAIITADHRLSMCELAFSHMDKVVVSDMEIKRQGKSYTVDTLRSLSRLHPDSELYLIMGADSFMQLPLWHEAEAIFSLATILTVSRGEVEYEELMIQRENYKSQYGARVGIVEDPIALISSTEIRNAISKKQDFSHMLHPDVTSYICKNKLYGYEY